MKKAFRRQNFTAPRLRRLKLINGIIEEYQAAGYVLTLRQLYYQLVSRDVIPNQKREYANLSSLLTDGRMNGIVDWNAIEDRLRKPDSPDSFDGPEAILDACINQYEKPRMEGQENYIEVWVEKDALSGVLKRVTEEFHIPIMVNRGYSSASAMYDAYRRFNSRFNEGQAIRILYLGDFDPSGMDMIRDVNDRITEFFGPAPVDFEIVPIALTREQIDEYNPPPNPAKRTDSRFEKFSEEHGTTSWEVDALRPEVLDQILRDAIEERIDTGLYNQVCSDEEADIEKLRGLKKYLD